MTDDAVPTPDQTPAAWSPFAASYDDWLMPITRMFAEDVVPLLAVHAGSRVLDVAAGSGAFAFAAAGAGAEVLAVDFAPGMVEVLRRKAEADGAAIEVREMDGQALSLPDASFDAAASLFGLIFFPDTAAGAAELHRVLRAGGRAAVVAWAPDGLAIHPMALDALATVGVEQPQQSTLPAAFRLSAPDRLRALLVAAGFTDVAVVEVTHAFPVADPEALFRSIPSWSAPLRPLFQRLTPEQHRDGEAAFVRLMRERSSADGLAMRALIATGTR
jgi:SAM-dependent methyltransferase